jgi:hypothetical protein
MTKLDRTSIAALRLLLDAQPTTGAKVAFAWTIAAGPSLARASTISWSETGTLHVRPRTDAWRREIVRARPVITQRVAALLGPDVIRRIAVADSPDDATHLTPPR